MVRELEQLHAELEFAYRLCDVDADAALARRYGDRVPVLLAGGTELCRYFLDADRLREYCRRS
jgi:thioredoxin reductase (NADPH)